jgi:tripartite-type tricarboxylate transporter receptor subunit TctC
MSRIAGAQAYPTRPVRWNVGVAPGGTLDILARLMGQRLTEQLGQQFIIENRPGGGTNIATETVVRAPADAIRSSWLLRRTRLTRRSIRSSTSISSATSRRSQVSVACHSSWW